MRLQCTINAKKHSRGAIKQLQLSEQKSFQSPLETVKCESRFSWSRGQIIPSPGPATMKARGPNVPDEDGGCHRNIEVCAQSWLCQIRNVIWICLINSSLNFVVNYQQWQSYRGALTHSKVPTLFCLGPQPPITTLNYVQFIFLQIITIPANISKLKSGRPILGAFGGQGER